VSIDQCACKRGFFTLRDCGAAATTSCSLCTRRVCDEHLAPRVDARVCVECAAKQQEDVALESEAEPTFTAVRRRTSWYQSYDYSPMWWATSDPYWNASDYRWYGDGVDDDDGGGFGDS
jgi:hypothetical protein